MFSRRDLLRYSKQARHPVLTANSRPLVGAAIGFGGGLVCVCVCVCVCVFVCLCVFSASASLCCHTALLPLPRQRLRLARLVVYVLFPLLSPGEPSLEGLHFGPSCLVRVVCQRNSRHPRHRYLLLPGIALCGGDRSCIGVSNSGTYVIHAFVLPRHARRVCRGDDPHSDVYAATTLVGQTLPPVDI